MKKAVRITAWILALLILLQIAVMVVLQSPRVQTFLGQKFIERMQDRMDADISFASASVRPFDAIVLDDVLVMDRAPVVESMDTLLYIKHLSARFSLVGLLTGESIYVKRAKLDGGCFHLVMESDPLHPDKPTTNLQRIFRLQTNNGNTEFHWGNVLRARSVEINEVHFRMENLTGEERMAERGIVWEEGVIDWNHLNLVLTHADVSGLKIQDDLITCSADRLSIRELETGLRMENLGAKRISVGKGNIHLDNFAGQLGETSHLNISRLDINGKLDTYSDFVNRVRLDITLREGSYVDMKTVSHFAPNLSQMSFRGRIRGRMSGTVNDFLLSDMFIEGLDDEILLKTTGRITGLPDVYGTTLDFQVNEFSFGMDDLSGFICDWAPQTDLSSLKRLAPGEQFSLIGRVSGRLNDMDFSGSVNSRLGSLHADLYMDNAIDQSRPITIGGRLDTDNLHMGRILGIRELGHLTLDTQLECLFPKNGTPQLQLDTLHITQLQALDYEYSGITAAGHYKNTDFDLRLRSTDPHLQLNARGAYHETAEKDGYMRVNAQLDHADLQALNLDKRGKSVVDSLRLEANLNRKYAHTLGSARASGLILENDAGRRPISDITLHIDAADSLHQLRLVSDLMDASFTGSRSAMVLVQDLRNLVLGRDIPALSPKELPAYSGALYSVSAQVHDLRDVLSFAVPGLYVENGTRLQLDVNRRGILTADLLSGRLAMNGHYIKDMTLHLDNYADALNGVITGSVIALSGARMQNNRLSVRADDNRLKIGYVFSNEGEDDTHAELNLSGELSRAEPGVALTARALPSSIVYKGNGWDISSGDINYSPGNVHIDRLLAYHGNQQLLVNGGYAAHRADTLIVTMDQFDIALANTILGDKVPTLEGKATGRAMVLSTAAATPGLLAGIVCDSTRIGGKRLGQLRLNSIWDEVNNRFVGNISTLLDGRGTLEADAYLVPSSRDLQMEMQLNRFDLGYAGYYLSSVFHEFDGALSGKVTLGGKLDALHLGSKDLRIDDGLLNVDFTRVPYHIQGDLALDDHGLHFKRVDISDAEEGIGSLNGSLLFSLKDLENMRMDIHILMRNMRALALPPGVNPVAYGDVYANGRIDVLGPLSQIQLIIDASNAKEGEFHLPLGSSATTRSRNLLTFTEAKDEKETDLYEQMMAANQQSHSRKNDLQLSARIMATPELKAYIDIDDDNSLTASGSGTIELSSSTAQDYFSLGGDYAIQDGIFHFSVLNLVTRKFNIQEGSTVRFNGNIWDTDLNVKGLYVTKASLSNLLPSYDESDAGSSGRRTVNCGINISGKIRNPEVDFDIEVPDLNPVVQGQVESALNSEDKVQKQFVYLLIAGNFLPTEESGVTTDGSNVLYSNVSSIMSGQLNNIFQKLDIPLDLGLNYQTTQAGKDLFDVAVSTQLFRGRVLVNGTVGNKQLEGGATTNEVAGDLDIEIKLNRSGSLRMSLFSHSADQYTYYLDNSQRNGAGIAYQREFNSFGQFFRELFAGRSKREAMALEAATHPPQNVVLQIDSTGKSIPTHAIR